ncbi:MAG: bifunctional hydroxymethylpyrimidine kinase/phosphomethylpyrimidine kinase [Holophaga sp.]|nr:bifunctional hydroxymethylpyrimidine kinase/phosphomethylpyrimidine kinase [Holophaga sp.]
MHAVSALEPAIPVALCLGGLDPSAGAGILRDALTLWEVGTYPMGIPVAETIQNGLGCGKILAPSMPPIERLESLGPHLQGAWGVKLGLCALPLSDLRSVVALLAKFGPRCSIWDPIQAPTSGVGLHDGAGLRRMAEIILGQGAWVVCPNRPEAAAFGDLKREASPEQLAQAYLGFGAKAVWLKGGHGTGHVEDFWVDATGSTSLGVRPRLAGDRRGTGCTLASAWLGFRLRGADDLAAARQACAWMQDRWPRAALPGGIGRPSFAPVVP